MARNERPSPTAGCLLSGVIGSVEASCVRAVLDHARQKNLCIFTESGPLIVLAKAAGMVLGMVGPTSAQFFNFGGFQQRPQPQRGGGGFGGG